MMTYAYDESYLPLAQRIMGDMLDYAVNTLAYDIKEFYKMFLVCGIAKQFEIGNPTYVAGKNGCEVARIVIRRSTGDVIEQPDVMYLDKSKEYWSGWTLAYYQWVSGQSFRQIDDIAGIKEICGMYSLLHEADVSKFVDIMDEKRAGMHRESGLKRFRAYAGLSQSQLAGQADVPLRQIQLFEQKQRDIHKTQADTLLRLAAVLQCDCKELL